MNEQRPSCREDAADNPDSPEERPAAIDTMLESYYRETLRRYTISSWASVGAAVFGFLVITVCLVVAWFSDKTALGYVGALVAGVGDGAMLLFFKQTQSFQRQVQDALDKLIAHKFLMTTISLSRELPGQDRRDQIVEINSHLRTLMNWLLGNR